MSDPKHERDHCGRGPCYLGAGHDGPCVPGGANDPRRRPAEKDQRDRERREARKFGTDVPHEPTDEFVVQAFAEGARSLWPDSRDPGWHVTFRRWLADFVVDHAWPGEVLGCLGDVWAKCGCGERIDVTPTYGETVTSGDVRTAYKAHLIAATQMVTPPGEATSS